MNILAVCLGNICRSPLAQGILQHMVDKHGLSWNIDSAGTSDWHIGEPPCEGSIAIAQNNGIAISSYSGRQVSEEDFENFDLILAMDSENYNELISIAGNKQQKDKVKLILNYSYPGQNRSVPDSYFTKNYKEVFDLLYEACLKIVYQYEHLDS